MYNIENSRPKYTDYEICNLFKKKRKDLDLGISEVAKHYNTDETIISFLDEFKSNLSLEMIEIASDFLSIEFNELTDILVDDDLKISARGALDEGSMVVFDTANNIFNKLIHQIRMSN